MRMTKNREQVYKEIINSSVPLTAYEVGERLKNMSLTTVYRALEYLYQNGYLKRFSLDDYTYYYSSSVHRHFFRCVECGRLFPIDECHMNEYENYLSEQFKFKIQEHFVLFSGLCEECYKREA
ncbi:Fur family transcriptional regulator [Fervidobacterium sp.]